MKSFAIALVVLQAVLIQNAYTQCIRSAPVTISSPLISAVAQPSVAASLADTLSLLTVSSLLAESLPLNPNVVAAVPVPVGPACVPALAYNGCGCGGCDCGCGFGGCGYGCGYRECDCGCGFGGCGCGYCGLGYGINYIL